jgi:photosystem II stability/assembly factor-like uncharacterized protein
LISPNNLWYASPDIATGIHIHKERFSMNRHLSGIFILLLILFLAACQSSASTPPESSALQAAGAPATPVQVTATAVPPEEPADRWQIVRQIQPEHRPKYAAFLNETFGVTGCGQIGRPSFTADGGQSWMQPAIGQFCPSSVDIVDSQSIWLCGPVGVFSSKDGGQSLYQMYSPLDGCRILNFIDDNYGWSSFEWNLAATSDGAIRWVEIEKAFDMGEIAAISLRTALDAYVLTHEGILFSTNDGGSSWSSNNLAIVAGGVEIANMDGRPAAVMRFLDEENGIIIINLSGAGRGELLALHTADSGQTWERHVLPLNPGAVYLSHDGQYVTVTEHGGAGGITILEQRSPIENRD